MYIHQFQQSQKGGNADKGDNSFGICDIRKCNTIMFKGLTHLVGCLNMTSECQEFHTIVVQHTQDSTKIPKNCSIVGHDYMPWLYFLFKPV